jgi:NAD(P)-dependent dehydrogenase (short-subunit alcohol dehydrogenase family)
VDLNLDGKRALVAEAAAVGRPDDIAFTVTFLASPLSDFINGANVRVDGGASPPLTDAVD